MKEGKIRKLPFRTPVCHSEPAYHSARPLVIPSLPRNPSPFCVVTTSRCFDFAQHDSLFPHSEHALLSFRTPSCHSAHPLVIPSLPGISLTERPFVILHALLSFRACRGISLLFVSLQLQDVSTSLNMTVYSLIPSPFVIPSLPRNPAPLRAAHSPFFSYRVL